MMGQVYNFLGLSVGVINSNNVSYLYDSLVEAPTPEGVGVPTASVGKDKERDTVGEFKIVYDFLKPCSRKESYRADVTYGTNHEYGFDYLRDNLAVSEEGVVQRGHHYAIVDEVDSILIDEARTPLIISSAAGDSEDFYFRFYKILSGMTGTAETSAEEFLKVYGLDVIVIPTNRPVVRKDHNDLIFQTEKGKFQAIAKKVKELNTKGVPVLIGTISIEKNELLSAYLRQEGVPHVILNAKNHEKEGEIIAQAGKRGAVTIATNMAGRGIDIKLGGNPIIKEEYEFVKNAGGLFVLGTERHEARRIDNQLRGRSGRQGDPGGTIFYVSLEDDLMRVFGSERIKTMMGRFGIPEDQPIENRFIGRTLEGAQAKIEGFHFDARKNTLEYDDVMNHQRKIIYERRNVMLHSKREEVEDFLQDIIKWKEKVAPTPERVGVPTVSVGIEEKRKKLGDDAFFEVVRRIALYTTDTLWMEHLEAMDYLRSSVNLRAYGQREPIVEYKKDGLMMFKQMEETFKEQVCSLIGTITEPAKAETNQIKQTLVTSQDNEQNGMKPARNASSIADAGGDIGRNDPCPCGAINPATGEVYKYKKCGLINAPQHRKSLVN